MFRIWQRRSVFILVLDEYPYLAERTEFFNSMLQHLIDYEFQKTNLFLILCGSQISFMEEEEVLGAKSPLFGRRTSQFEIKPFNYFETAKFLKNFSNEDKVKFYATFGGTPYYLEQINVNQSYEDNVKRLFLQTGGYLYEEPMMLLRQELKETAIYNTIITAIAGGASKVGEIVNESGFRDSRQVSPYLDKLVKLRIVNKLTPFGENMKKTRNKRYVLADHFFAFWFQYIFSNRSSVEDQLGEIIFQKEIAPDLNRFIGKSTFEEICLSYLSKLNKIMKLPFLSSIKGSWWGVDQSQQTGNNQTDIDVIMADKSERKIILGECKWKNQLNDVADISNLLEKKRLLPRYQEYYFYFFSKIPYSPAAYKLAEENDHLKLIELDDLYKF
ncbi:MAG: ATP-binding protein [Lactobacillales bacterium]|nr:ATP-binding protein [Lactobacillales bacterium]